MAKIVKDTPLAEITLRKYEKPHNLKERELVRKICLSVGLLQPGDSRDVMVDVLHVLIRARKKKQGMTSQDIEKAVIGSRKKQKLPMLGIASSNIRRQIKRLKDILLIEKVANKYRIAEFEPLSTIFSQKIEQFYMKSITERVKEYFDVLK
jgi:hypothetical protein